MHAHVCTILSNLRKMRNTSGMKPTIVIIGAGSAEFTRELLGDLFSFPELTSARVVLHDIDPERLETAEAIAHATARAAGAHPEVVTATDRRRALDGADYVINVIQVGMHQATVRDFEIPARYGLNQTIGDTIGVGGIFRGLRTFPVLAGIAKDMTELCPDAWLLNYTNPMAMNVSYLHHVAPRLKVLGLCHSVHWTMVGLCELIDVPFDDVSFWSAGVNHQAWVLQWERAGQNLYPLLEERIAADPELRKRVRVDMYRRLGYYPTETSEHSSEYVPWYLRRPDEIARLRLNVGEYVGISEANLAEYARVRAELAQTDTLAIDTSSTEYAPQVIHSLETGTARVISANVVNDGLITNLPNGVAVEVPTLLDSLGAHPVRVGDLPPQCAALNRSFLGPVDLAVRAAVDGDPRLVPAAAMVDPNTAATLTLDEIWQLCADLTVAHGDLLPEPLRVPARI
jgi:alpha-galactosidase